jgi:hypothetical protein
VVSGPLPDPYLADPLDERVAWCTCDKSAVLKLDADGPPRCAKCGQPPRRTAEWAEQARKFWPA